MKWISKLFVRTINNFCADSVRRLNKSYSNGFSKKQKKYKNKICKEIIDSALHGARAVYTEDSGWEDWITEEYLLSLKEYFIAKGFEVTSIYDEVNLCLKISW